jgi:hypothetical protein
MRFLKLLLPWPGLRPATWRGFFFLTILALPDAIAHSAESTNPPVRIRFVDSATGFAVQPDVTETTPHDAISAGWKLRRSNVNQSGRATLSLPGGRHTISVRADGYQPMSGEFEVLPGNPYQLQFQLDPAIVPREIQPEYVTTLHRVNETVFVGYVAEDESGEPLVDTVVRTEPSGRETRTDARGYFQIYVPVQTLAEATNTPAKLIFAKPGFRPEVRSHLELWSEGDWVYRIQLQSGEGEYVLDERTLRRRSGYPIATREETPTPSNAESATTPAAIETALAAAAISGEGVVTQQLASTTAHVRIPTNIRVLRQDGFTIDYISLQTYCQRSLPSEWIASWGSTGPGNSGTNCLLAGAVAIRTYAAGFVNSPDDVNYDICGTTSCQAYIHTASDSRTTAAVNATANWVMFKPGATRIGFKITEYSAENNSAGFGCGDGYTQPTGGCIADPVCLGEVRFGHGRGMCQWGTARWASGRRMQNRVTGDSVTNGYPLQNWIWLCEHYYPDLVLAQGAPLVIGDDVKVLGVASLSIRECPGNNITNGTLCPQVATKVSGSMGTIIGGPSLVTADGIGHTWWQVDWGDTNGWCVENYLERVSATPGTPTGLTATVASAYRINLNWSDAAANEIGTYIERATASGGPWTSNAFVRAGLTTFADTNVNPNTTYHYRVRTFNQTATSAYSNTTNTTTPGLPPVLTAIPNKTVFETILLTFTNTATATDFVTPLTDFEAYAAGAEIMFQEPRFSGSTSGWMSNAPNVSLTTGALPTGSTSARALNVSWAFTNNATTPWVRLTTASVTTLPNPVIDLTKRLRLRIWSDKAIRVGLGIREATIAAGTAIGSNGGGTGAIEWVGITSSSGGQPQPTRTVNASNWTTLEFNFTTEPVLNFVSGNGVLSTASGLAVLEHIAFAPVGNSTTHNLYLDDFEVFTPNALTYSLSNAPSGATIGASSGVFTWTPTEVQGPGIYNLGVIVTDSGTPPQSDLESFSVTVNETNAAPLLTIPPTQNITELAAWTATNSATDADLPANTLTFGLVSGPLGLTLTPGTGAMNWTPAEDQGPGSYPVTVRVFDNGLPALSVTNIFTIHVNETNAAPSLTAIASKTVHAGTLVTQTTSATDSDLPVNTLNYSLLAPPPNANIASGSGDFSWQTSDADANTTNNITVQVTDDGAPLLSDTEIFAVTILPRPLIQQIELVETNIVLTWSAISGSNYRVQAKTNLNDVTWFDLTPNITATNATATRIEPLGEAVKFYRVRVLDP